MFECDTNTGKICDKFDWLGTKKSGGKDRECEGGTLNTP